ncbi:hypothetical protein C0431_14325 [bacterium]|nr:hypothetical protein [bacterium]
MPQLLFTPQAKSELASLKSNLPKLKRVNRCLALIESNPRHPGLNSHKYTSLKGANGEDVWESYVENNTPAAWRIFWHYGPDQNQITIIAITPHP